MPVLDKILNKIKNGEIVLLISPARLIQETDFNVLKYLTNKADTGVYVTINRPYYALKRVLDEHKINTDKVFFIDLISSSANTKPERTEKCLFLSSPSDLTELGVVIDQYIKSLNKDETTFIFIDNLSAFLIYNNIDIMSEFAHFLVTKMRMNNVLGVIISVEEEMGNKLIGTLSSLCDRTEKVTNKWLTF